MPKARIQLADGMSVKWGKNEKKRSLLEKAGHYLLKQHAGDKNAASAALWESIKLSPRLETQFIESEEVSGFLEELLR